MTTAILIPDENSNLKGTVFWILLHYMSSLCLHGFSPGALASSQDSVMN